MITVKILVSIVPVLLFLAFLIILDSFKLIRKNVILVCLGRVMAKLPETSETVIAMNFLVMNLSSLLQKTKKEAKSKKL